MSLPLTTLLALVLLMISIMLGLKAKKSGNEKTKKWGKVFMLSAIVLGLINFLSNFINF